MNTAQGDWKTAAVGVALGLWILSGVYGMFFRVENTIGPIGADKVGRQVLLQSLNDYHKRINHTEEDLVASEWQDTNFVQRFFIQEPMRTTFIMLPSTSDPRPSLDTFNAFLDASYSSLLSQYRGKITLQDELEQTPGELDKRLRKMGCHSMRDYLGKWGFKRFEVRYGKELMFACDLDASGSVNWVGGNK